MLASKPGAFGGTPFGLNEVDDSGLGMELHVPVSALKALRRALWAWKDQNPLPRVDPAREAAIYCRLLEQAEALGLSRQATARVLAAIVGRDFRA